MEFLDFDSEIRKLFCQGRFTVLENWNAELQVAVSRPFQLSQEYFQNHLEKFDFSIQFKRKPTKDFILRISLLSHYLDNTGRTIISESCERYENIFHLKEDIEYQLYSKNKSEMILYLQERFRNKPNEFFGWLLQEDLSGKSSKGLFENIMPVTFWRIKKKAIKPERKRGYSDHGSLGSEFSKTCKQQSTDYSVLDLWNEILENRQRQQDTLDFVKGWLY